MKPEDSAAAGFILPRTTIGDIFLEYDLPTDVRIMDMACGVGAVAEEIAMYGYKNVDGLDPIKGYLEAAQSKGLYKNVYQNFVDPKTPTPIEDGIYDVVLCCAGFFQGLISPLALPELARICKPGGMVIWNIAEGFEDYGKDFVQHDRVVDGMVADKVWRYAEPVRRLDKLVFTDSGAAMLSGYENAGLSTEGFVYIMRKL